MFKVRVSRSRPSNPDQSRPHANHPRSPSEEKWNSGKRKKKKMTRRMFLGTKSRILILELCFHRWALKSLALRVGGSSWRVQTRHRHVWVNKWQGLCPSKCLMQAHRCVGVWTREPRVDFTLARAYKYVYWAPWITRAQLVAFFHS